MSVETTEHPLDDLDGFREIPRWAFNQLAEEWRRRTWFGKLFYPIYLFDRTLMAMFILTVLSPFAIHGFMKWFAWRVGRAWGNFRRHFPATYKTNDEGST